MAANELGVSARANELVGYLQRKDGKGNYVLADREAKAVIVLVSLGLARADKTLEFNRFVMEQLGAFAAEAGLKTSNTDGAVGRLEKHLLSIIPADVVTRIEQFFREEVGAGGGGMGGKVAEALGVTRKQQPLDSGARPKGTVAAGPMARFQVQVPPKK